MIPNKLKTIIHGLLLIPEAGKQAIRDYHELEGKCVILSIQSGKDVRKLMRMAVDRAKTGPTIQDAFNQIKREVLSDEN
jgi:hypothetical protein